METVVTLTDVFQYLEITVAVLLIIVLYHILFITVGFRKILRRIETITSEIQEVIMKPMNVADHILEGIVKYMDTQGAAPKKGSKKTKAKKKK
jgi:cell shape-determining protein MreC